MFSVQDQEWSRIVARYRAKMRGGVRINVKQSSTPALLRDVKRGAVDVAFTGTMGPDPDIQFTPCWSQEAVLVVNRRHPFADRSEISLAELADHYLISYNLTGPLGPELTELVKGHDLVIDYLYSDEITLASIVAGSPDVMAIACRSWLLDSYGSDVSLVSIAEAPKNFHQMYLCSRARTKHPQSVVSFMEVVRQCCAERA